MIKLNCSYNQFRVYGINNWTQLSPIIFFASLTSKLYLYQVVCISIDCNLNKTTMMVKLIFPLIICALLACSKDDTSSTFLNCNEHTDNFEKYNGEVIDCQFHYKLTEYSNEQYIELIAPCADLTRPYVINVDCIDICENEPYNEDSECGQYLISRQILEIVLIKN